MLHKFWPDSGDSIWQMFNLSLRFSSLILEISPPPAPTLTSIIKHTIVSRSFLLPLSLQICRNIVIDDDVRVSG